MKRDVCSQKEYDFVRQKKRNFFGLGKTDVQLGI